MRELKVEVLHLMNGGNPAELDLMRILQLAQGQAQTHRCCSPSRRETTAPASTKTRQLWRAWAAPYSPPPPHVCLPTENNSAPAATSTHRTCSLSILTCHARA